MSHTGKAMIFHQRAALDELAQARFRPSASSPWDLEMNLQVILPCPGDTKKQKHLFLALSWKSPSLLTGVAVTASHSLPTSFLASTIHLFAFQSLERSSKDINQNRKEARVTEYPLLGWTITLDENHCSMKCGLSPLFSFLHSSCYDQ